MFFRIGALLISIFLLAFGQPAKYPLFGLLAATVGWAPFFVAIHDLTKRQRFWIGTAFFFSIQLLQLFWFTSHPFAYIWGVYFALAFLFGLQCGILSLLVTKERLQSIFSLLLLPALWAIFEWSRLFLFTGFPFNFTGMAFASNDATSQLIGLFGIFGLSFLSLLSSAAIARWYIWKKWGFAIALLAVTAIASILLFEMRKEEMKRYDESVGTPLKLLIIHTKDLPEELDCPHERKKILERVLDCWQGIEEIAEPYKDGAYDMVILPEMVVPFAAESPLFEVQDVKRALQIWDQSGTPGIFQNANKKSYCHFDLAQDLASRLNCHVIIGLETDEYSLKEQCRVYFNSVYCFTATAQARYDKQILVPMGEYIPFVWLKGLAAQYGLYDSFLRGDGTRTFSIGPHLVAPSICYEDTFPPKWLVDPAIQRATALVNVTNDGWYPNSSLGRYHFETARIRALENGKPFFRSCNFGFSGAFDSLGRTVLAFDDSGLEQKIDAFPVTLSSFNYTTFYSLWGNCPVILGSCLIIILAIACHFLRKRAQ